MATPTWLLSHSCSHSHSHSHSHGHPYSLKDSIPPPCPYSPRHPNCLITSTTWKSTPKRQRHQRSRSHLAFLILATATVSTLTTTTMAAAPTPPWRAFHGAAIVDTSMVIFGGTTDPAKNPYGPTILGSNDLWIWSTTLRQWSQPTIQSGGLPNPQKFFTSVPLLSQGKMLSLVGNASAAYNNLLMLDIYNWIWSIPTSRKQATSRPKKTACICLSLFFSIFLVRLAFFLVFDGYHLSLYPLPLLHLGPLP
ncbi:hypothetical protein F5H01DRAFT_45825 [Linnemannia elongata]|nr:hypothetical protein F5H01DRAFT_45825 [Linnemannia elongata]